MEDRIGIIGNTQGVNVSSRPVPNAPRTTHSHVLVLGRIDAVVTGETALAAGGTISLGATAKIPAGPMRTAKRLAIGG